MIDYLATRIVVGLIGGAILMGVIALADLVVR